MSALLMALLDNLRHYGVMLVLTLLQTIIEVVY